MDSSNIHENKNENELLQNSFSSISNEGPGPSKKRKSSMAAGSLLFDHQLKVLRFENDSLKKLIEELEDKQRQFESNNDNELTDFIKLKENIKKLEANVETLKAANEEKELQHKAKIDSLNSEYLLRINILENDKQKLEKSVKTLYDEIADMKAIKLEIKDTVEDDRQSVQETIGKLKAEIDDLKKMNIDLINDKQLLQSMIDQYKKNIDDDVEKNNEEVKYLLLNDVVDDNSDLLLSCKPKKILEVSKIIGSESGINFFSTTNNNSDTPSYFMKDQDFRNTCFKLNLEGDFIIKNCCKKFNEIMSRVNLCKLTKIHLCQQKIRFADFIKLVSTKSVQICIFEKTVIVDDNFTSNDIYKLLKELPNIVEFQYEFFGGVCLNEAAKNFSQQLQTFRDLQKFQLSNLHHSFKLEDFFGFLKNNKSVSYAFKFDDSTSKTLIKNIERSEKKLLKLLDSLNCNLSIEYKKL